MSDTQRSPSRTRSQLGWIVAGVLGLTVVVLALLLARGDTPTSAGTPAGASTVSTATGPTTRTSPGSGANDSASGLPWADLAELPAQARETIVLIQRGGPYPYRKDGATFGNREGLLPSKSRGHYREYTVPTPGSDDRGARRIVTGERDTVFYYTDDHYDSFRRVRL